MTTRTLDLIPHARLADLPPETLDAILAEVDAMLEHADDTDPAQYEAAADRFFAAIRAAAEGEE
ncbi:MAG: hypothetical protein MUF27_03360 [Acidobacteria bacterium]|nr:hypothetical protein [Acidobacteriota bacterium]